MIPNSVSIYLKSWRKSKSSILTGSPKGKGSGYLMIWFIMLLAQFIMINVSSATATMVSVQLADHQNNLNISQKNNSIGNNRIYAARVHKQKTSSMPADARSQVRNRQRRIIFNDDGGETRAPGNPLFKPTDFLAVRIAPLAGTQVDTIVFDTTSGTFNRFAHRTAVAEMFLLQDGRYQYNLLPKMLPLGTDPLQVVIKHCHDNGQEVFWSMRMNDTHDSANPVLMSRMKQQHPEYLFGTKEKRPKYGKWTAIDYGRAEVRDIVQRTIAEVAANYDVDGVELDFWRHPVFFRKNGDGLPAGDEERKQMTTLLRNIRLDLDKAGSHRGRPILLSVKVPDSVGYSRDIGLDIETWLEEGLIDLFVPGGTFQFNQWTESVKLARKYNVKIYACLADNRLIDKQGNNGRSSIEALRARAIAAWTAGVDGIHMFNHFNPKSSLWRELGDPSLLRTLPKRYFLSVQNAPNSRAYYPAGGHISIPTLTPDAPDMLTSKSKYIYELYIGDDLRNVSALRASLVLQVARVTGNPPQVLWDEKPLTLQSKGEKLWSASIESHDVTPGLHHIAITANDHFRLEDLMLEINNRSPAQSSQKSE